MRETSLLCWSVCPPYLLRLCATRQSLVTTGRGRGVFAGDVHVSLYVGVSHRLGMLLLALLTLAERWKMPSARLRHVVSFRERKGLLRPPLAARVPSSPACCCCCCCCEESAEAASSSPPILCCCCCPWTTYTASYSGNLERSSRDGDPSESWRSIR